MSLKPASLSFIGNPATGGNAIVRGTDWSRRVQIKRKVPGGVSVVYDLSPYRGINGFTRGEIRLLGSYSGPALFSTSNGTLSVLITPADGPNGIMDLAIPEAATIAATANGVLIPETARIQIEGRNGSTGKMERLLEGNIGMGDEVALSVT